MKTKNILFSLVGATTTISLATVIATNKNQNIFTKGTGPTYHMVLDKDSEVNAIDEGYLHEVNIKNNKIDIVGYQSASNAFGSIRRAVCGDFTYNGMIFNKSVINGFESLTVDFSGGTLYYVFTDFLMEDMTFTGHSTLTSGQAVDVPQGKAYFVVYNTSETPVTINSLDMEYECNGDIDSEMIFSKNSDKGGARSYARTSIFEDSFVELENNPTKYTNNYSVGKHTDPKEVYNDTWYRWNGRYLANSENLGTEFTFGMTIMGEFNQVADTNKNFHYNVWPQFSYVGAPTNEKGQPNDYEYVQTYIGNDNYEPLGAANALHPSDPYISESYTGRFFTDYRYINGNYRFADPDTTKIADGVTTFRQAYERFNMPFWFIKFHVYLGAE